MKILKMRLIAVAVLVTLSLLSVLTQFWEVRVSVAQVVPTPGSATYRYDSLGRVVQDAYPLNSSAYSYDAAGNRLSATQN